MSFFCRLARCFRGCCAALQSVEVRNIAEETLLELNSMMLMFVPEANSFDVYHERMYAGRRGPENIAVVRNAKGLSSRLVFPRNCYSTRGYRLEEETHRYGVRIHMCGSSLVRILDVCVEVIFFEPEFQRVLF